MSSAANLGADLRPPVDKSPAAERKKVGEQFEAIMVRQLLAQRENVRLLADTTVLAATDALTGLINRRTFMEQADPALPPPGAAPPPLPAPHPDERRVGRRSDPRGTRRPG